MMCLECGEQREIPVGQESDSPPGWKAIETNVDEIDGCVRVTVTEFGTGRIVYSARYSPEVARTLARTLTLTSFKIEDAT